MIEWKEKNWKQGYDADIANGQCGENLRIEVWSLPSDKCRMRVRYRGIEVYKENLEVSPKAPVEQIRREVSLAFHLFVAMAAEDFAVAAGNV